MVGLFLSKSMLESLQYSTERKQQMFNNLKRSKLAITLCHTTHMAVGAMTEPDAEEEIRVNDKASKLDDW